MRTYVRAVGGRVLPPRSSRNDEGMVIVEAALAIPALVAVAAAMIWALLVATTNLAVGDAARAAARELARGVPAAEALARAEASVPGAHASVEDAADAVAVVVSKQVSAPVPILTGMTVTVSQRIAVPREWL